jgi:hypothetical protein
MVPREPSKFICCAGAFPGAVQGTLSFHVEHRLTQKRTVSRKIRCSKTSSSVCTPHRTTNPSIWRKARVSSRKKLRKAKIPLDHVAGRVRFLFLVIRNSKSIAAKLPTPSTQVKPCTHNNTTRNSWLIQVHLVVPTAILLHLCTNEAYSRTQPSQ